MPPQRFRNVFRNNPVPSLNHTLNLSHLFSAVKLYVPRPCGEILEPGNEARALVPQFL